MAKIANPIYDTVFKYLMEDKKCAMFLLGAMLNCKISNVELKQTEVSQKIKDQLEIYRLDFSANIIDDEGNEKAVTIELQKAKLESDVVRFRKYLASQYSSESNIRQEGKKKIAIPIISIYILGYKCCEIDEPVIYGNPHFFNAQNNEIQDLKSNLIFGLIHRMIIVQVPCLKKNAKTKVEKYLSIFDQNNKVDKKAKNAHTLDIEESEEDSQFDCLVRRLERAHSDEMVQHAMDVEDEIYDEFLRLGEENAELRTTLMAKLEELRKMQQLISEKNKEIEQQKGVIQHQQNQIAEQQNQLVEKDNQLVEKDNQLINQQKSFVKTLSSLGKSEIEISTMLNIDIEKVKEFLK